MKQFLVLLLVQTMNIFSIAQCPSQTELKKTWEWVIPLKTTKTEVEKVFGQSITKDKDSPYQTYIAEFGRITIAFAKEREFLKHCSCYVNAGTIVLTIIAPESLKLSDLNYDLSKFEKDVSPNEITYFNAKEGVLIDTEIIELEDKSKIEKVSVIEYRPKNQSKN